MKALIEIVHPADVLFFLNPIRRLKGRGHTVVIVSRDKDVALPLLQALGLSSQCLSQAGRGMLGLGWELIKRDITLWRLVRSLKPDVMCGFGGVSISHVGKLLGIPAISFYDTDRAPLQHALSLPFVDHLYVPEAYAGPTAPGRTTRFAGTKELSYFHPDNFVPDLKLAADAGLDRDRPNYFVRLVSWSANHDLGRGGWADSTLRALIEYLLPRGKVHLSSESPLPSDLSEHRIRCPVHSVHHLLAGCETYIGESATMAAEACMLGVPAIYAADDQRGYIDELAHIGLVRRVLNVTPVTLTSALASIETQDRQQWDLRRQSYLADKPNLADYVVAAILGYTQSDHEPNQGP